MDKEVLPATRRTLSTSNVHISYEGLRCFTADGFTAPTAPIG